MKKFLILILISLLTLGLVACGNSGNGESKDASSKQQHSTESNQTSNEDDSSNNNEGEVTENEIGKITVVNKKKDINQTFQSGPVNLTINAIQTATLEPSESYKDMFDGKEKLTIVTINMKTENTSDDTVGIYPNQAVLTTNTGEQVDADIWLSDDLGGDFYGKVSKEGDVIFQLDSPAEEISNMKLIIEGAHDTDYNSLSEQLHIDLSF